MKYTTRFYIINTVQRSEIKMGMSLGQFISIRRKRMLMTQEELAKKTNVSKSAIAKWETDGGIPDRDNLYKLANILGVTVNDMHQIIRSMKYKDIDLTINITPDIIEILESYGYKVIRPNEREE